MRDDRDDNKQLLEKINCFFQSGYGMMILLSSNRVDKHQKWNERGTKC